MTQIRDLFDTTRALNRPIEKVITYQNRAEAQLRTEISEYVVTEHIEESFSDLLKKMQLALKAAVDMRSVCGSPASMVLAKVPSRNISDLPSTAA